MLMRMRSALPLVAFELGADERTLRRAVERGTVRCERPTPRSSSFASGEIAYLRAHWGLLGSLLRALRTEPNVRLAVLYGSAARGTDRPDSDIDVLVDLRDEEKGSASALARRLEGHVGRHVDVARLPVVRKGAPFLLLQALDEGRVLVDREEAWMAVREARDTIARAARRQNARERAEAIRSLGQLLEEL